MQELPTGQIPLHVGKVSPQDGGIGVQVQVVPLAVQTSFDAGHAPPQTPLASMPQGFTHRAAGPGQQLTAPVASTQTHTCSHIPLTQWSTVQGFPSLQSRSVWQDGGGRVVVVLVVVIAVVVVTQSGPGPQQPRALPDSTQTQPCSHMPSTQRSTVHELWSSHSASLLQPVQGITAVASGQATSASRFTLLLHVDDRLRARTAWRTTEATQWRYWAAGPQHRHCAVSVDSVAATAAASPGCSPHRAAARAAPPRRTERPTTTPSTCRMTNLLPPRVVLHEVSPKTLPGVKTESTCPP